MNSALNRFYVSDDSDLPADVRRELEQYGPSGPNDNRAFGDDLALAVLSDLVATGIWDTLPLFAAFRTSSPAKSSKATAEQVTRRVARMCVSARLAETPDQVVVEEIKRSVRGIWKGNLVAKNRRVTFRANAAGEITVFDTDEPVS